MSYSSQLKTLDVFVKIDDDYRSGHSIKIITDMDKFIQELIDDGEDEDDARVIADEYTPLKLNYEGDFGFTIFIVKYTWPHEAVFQKWFSTKEGAENYMLKIYSLANGSLPFETNGYTESYKRTGYYPDIPDHIKDIEIDEDIVEELTGGDYIYSLIVQHNPAAVSEVTAAAMPTAEIVDMQMIWPAN